MSELGTCYRSHGGDRPHPHSASCINWASLAPQGERTDVRLHRERDCACAESAAPVGESAREVGRPIEPVGKALNPYLARWKQQGYASQESDGLWLHYTAVCEVLRSHANRKVEQATRELREALRDMVDNEPLTALPSEERHKIMERAARLSEEPTK